MATKLLEKAVPQSAEEHSVETCVHHWVIEPPDGPVSKGVCKKCGEEKEFNNYFPYSIWDNIQSDEDRTKSLLNSWSV